MWHIAQLVTYSNYLVINKGATDIPKKRLLVNDT